MRLVLDGRARRILARLPVTNVYSLLELLLIAGLAVQGARLLWTVVTPVNTFGDWRPAGTLVPPAPGSLLRNFDPFFRVSGAAGPATVTALQLQLFGTRLDEAMGRGSAIIAGPDGLQKSIAVGEEIIPGVRLKSVAFDHVTLDRGGADEDLFLDQSASLAATPQPAPPPAAPLLGAAPPSGASADRLRTEIGFIPRIDGGRLTGLVVRAQGTGALFRQAGLRDGDVVTAIGGQPVRGPDDLERVGAQFAGGGAVPLTVERGRDTVSLSIPVGPR